ncbi:MAG: HepT-like ribonuclease domain-containing protein [Phycisphaerales bacterium]
MPHKRDDIVILADMLAFAREVVEFVDGKSWEEYESDIKLRRAVERSVELIGEAARRISREFEENHPGIPWNKIIVQRHRLAHEYDVLDDGIIWSVAIKYVPELITQIKPIVEQHANESDNTP